MTEQAADRIVVCPVSPREVRSLLEPPAAWGGPCLSLYLPTHRRVPDNLVDLPAFHHLVEALGATLEADLPAREVERLLRPFRLLADDRRFWQHAREGLALLSRDGRGRAFLLSRPVPPLALVTDRFHTLPLVRLAASLERFHVLALTSRSARVYEGAAWYDGRGGAAGPLDVVPLVHQVGGVPEPTDRIAREEVVDEEVFQPHRVQRGMGIDGIVHGGAGSKDDDVDADTEIFLQHVDTTVGEQVSRPTGLPLVLVAGPRLAATFRRLARNPWLARDQVAKDPHLMTPETIAAEVLPVFTAARDRRITHTLRAFSAARDRELAQADLSDVARSAVAGRVATLLIEADRFEPGWLDRRTGAIAADGEPPRDLSRTGDEPAGRTEDLFGAVAETVILHRGTVMALARNQMPSESGVAAIYRY